MNLKLSNVIFSYASANNAVDDVTFSAEQGEIVGILGQNGCGKTTLLKCINKSLNTKSGTIFLDDTELKMMPRKEIAKNIGVVSQTSTIIFPYLVIDTVMMGRFPTQNKFDSVNELDLNIVYNAMEETGVTKFKDKSIDELSGGERQRVLIARALAQEPSILLLDEPTLHLDINHQFSLMDLVKRLSREKNMLVVFVTHDISLAARYCDRVIIMEHGKIYAAGSAKETITSKNLKEVFGINTKVYYEELIDGLNIIVIGNSD